MRTWAKTCKVRVSRLRCVQRQPVRLGKRYGQVNPGRCPVLTVASISPLFANIDYIIDPISGTDCRGWKIGMEWATDKRISRRLWDKEMISIDSRESGISVTMAKGSKRSDKGRRYVSLFCLSRKRPFFDSFWLWLNRPEWPILLN